MSRIYASKYALNQKNIDDWIEITIVPQKNTAESKHYLSDFSGAISNNLFCYLNLFSLSKRSPRIFLSR